MGLITATSGIQIVMLGRLAIARRGHLHVSHKEPVNPHFDDLWWDKNTDQIKVYRTSTLKPKGYWADNTIGKEYNDLIDRIDKLEDPEQLIYLYNRQAWGTDFPADGQIKLGKGWLQPWR